jgi:hypothetical protein
MEETTERESSEDSTVVCLALECQESSSEELISSEISSSENLSSSEGVSNSEEISSSEEVSSSEIVSSSETTSNSEVTSSEVTSSQVTSSSEVILSSEEVTSSETQPEQFAVDLFISEYIEGTSNNKAFEIANFTGQTVDLANYTVSLYGNGSLAVTKGPQALTGTLAHGEVFVIAGDSITDTGMLDALNAIPAEKKLISDFNAGSIAESYNGDDAFALLKDGVIIDIFGTIGFDPGASWAAYTYGQVADGVTVATADRTLTRLPGFGPKVGLIETYTAFDPLEWRIDATHYQTLGTHIYSVI